MARTYRITVSAVLGRSTEAALGDFVAQAHRAKAKVDEILSAPVKASARKAAGKDPRVTEAEKARAELERIRERENNDIMNDVAKRHRFEEREAERSAKHVARIKERYFREEQRRGEQEDARKAARRTSIASDSFGMMRKAAGAAVRVAGEVAGGFGVDMSIGGGVSRAVQRDAMARDISAQGFRGLPGEKAQDPAEIRKLAGGIADKYNFDETDVLGGLSKFQGLTGDLTTGKAALGDLSRLAKAFNVDMKAMMGAAGQVSGALGDIGEGQEFASAEEKAKALVEVMKTATAQGQEGAIEIADMATQFAKLKGAGVRFEGKASDNFAKMGALAQLAYQTGGAGSVSQASNAVLGFTNTLGTKARRDAFKANGVDVDSATSAGRFKNPYDIIKDSLIKTGGDTNKMKAMWGNILGEKAVNSMRTTFLDAGGGEKGLKAIDAMLARFGGTASDSQIATNLGTQMGSKKSQAQGVQNEFDKVSEQLSTDLAQPLRELAPTLVEVAKAFASIVTTAAAHPWGSVAAVIGGSIAASIAKAAIGDAVGKAIASGIGPANLGLGLLATAAIAAAAAIYDYESKSDNAKDKLDKDLPILIAKAQKQLKETGTVDKDTIDELAMRRAEIEGVRKTADKGDLGEGLGYSAILAAKMTGGADQIATAEGELRADKGKLDTSAAAIDALVKAYADSKPKKEPPTASDIGAAVATAVAPLVAGGPSAPTGGTVPQ